MLTNSLAANDVAAVHGGYSRHRKALIEGGVQLWEFKPLSGPNSSSLFGSSGASLHTKALTVDGRTLFVGSYNLDPAFHLAQLRTGRAGGGCGAHGAARRDLRDADVGSARLARDAARRQPALERRQENFDSDPNASAGRRFQAWITRVLHLDAQL